MNPRDLDLMAEALRELDAIPPGQVLASTKRHMEAAREALARARGWGTPPNRPALRLIRGGKPE